jgi:hypothetical protein
MRTHLRSRRSGLGLAELLIATALLSMIVVGFLRFQQTAYKSQSNMEQTNESISLDTALHQIFLNPTGCKVNAQRFAPYGTAAVNLTNQTIVDRNNAPFVFVGKRFANGLQVTSLTVEISAPDGGVHFVHYRVVLTKGTPNSATSAAMGAQTFTYDYYLNAAVFSGVPIDCLKAEDQPNSLKLVRVDSLQANAHNSGLNVNLVANGPPRGYPPNAYPWGGCCTNINVNPAAGCSMGPSGSCPGHIGPWTSTIQAKGNRMEINTAGNLGLAVLADLSGTPFNPGPPPTGNPNFGLGRGSFGASIFIELQDASTGTTATYGLGATNMGRQLPGHYGGSVTAVPQWINVTYNHPYRFRLIGRMSRNDFSPNDAYSAGYGDAALHIRHFIQSP